jgi:hypothetical protein
MPNPVDCLAAAKDPLTPTLSQRAPLGVLATQSVRIRKRMRTGEGVCCGLQHRPFSQPYPLADMAILYGKLAASVPWRAGNSKMARVQERAHASLLGEGQDEGVLSERINRNWH